MKKEEVGSSFGDALLSSLGTKQLLKALLVQLQKEENLTLEQLTQTFLEIKRDAGVPLYIFSFHLHPLESLCKYLKEQEHLSFGEIASLLGKNQQSLWAAYQRSKKKKRSFFPFRQERYFIPLTLFKNSYFSLMENVVLYLNRTYHFSCPEMAKLLHKSPNSMAVLLKRAKEKSQT